MGLPAWRALRPRLVGGHQPPLHERSFHLKAQPRRVKRELYLGITLGGEDPLEQRRAKSLALWLPDWRPIALDPLQPEPALLAGLDHIPRHPHPALGHRQRTIPHSI